MSQKLSLVETSSVIDYGKISNFFRFFFYNTDKRTIMSVIGILDLTNLPVVISEVVMTPIGSSTGIVRRAYASLENII